jgi:hypothetical protein
MTEQTYECAYCDREAVYLETAYIKWGMAKVYSCPVHGHYYVIWGPMRLRGEVVGPHETMD